MIYISLIASIFLLVSICQNDRTKSLKISSLHNLTEALYNFLINAHTAAFLGIINFVRTILFAYKNSFQKKFYFALLILFEIIIIWNCFYTWNGYISLFPTCESMIKVLCIWQSKMKLIRVSGIITGALYSIYYSFYGSWILLFAYIILFIVSTMAIYTNDLKKDVSII